jgi:DNA repair protein RecN (Recombination protein N)
LSVQKNISKNNTKTNITSLNPEEKIQEIARMLGGLKVTEQTVAHARELCNAEN